jgi:hypothetical protein
VPLPDGPWFNTVEMYDPVTDTWTRKASMPTAHGAFGCAAAFGRIYVMGGRSQATYATTEEYDPASNTWQQRASMPLAITSLAASELDGRIYVIGGYTATIQPAPGVASVFQYAPPITQPLLEIVWKKMADQNIVHLKWLSRADCLDTLQFRSQAETGSWSEVQQYPGTGGLLDIEIPETGPSGLYRLLRGLK